MKIARTFFSCLLAICLVFGLAPRAGAETVVAEFAEPGAVVTIDTSVALPGATGDVAIATPPRLGEASVDGAIVSYTAAPTGDGLDRFKVQVGDDADDVLRVDIIVGEPAFEQGEAEANNGDSNSKTDAIYEELGDLLFKLLVVAIILEIALTTLFKNRRFLQIDAVPGIKTSIAILVSLLVVVVFNLDIFGQMIAAIQERDYPGTFPKIVSYSITALIIAGGSTTVYTIYTRLGIRPQTATGQSGAVLQGDGKLKLKVNRVSVTEKERIQVLLNSELVGIIEADLTKFGGDTGLQISSGAYELKLTSNDKTGQAIERTRALGVEPGKLTDLTVEV